VYIRRKRGGSPDSPHDYLQLVEGYRSDGRVRQRVIANLGRWDELVSDGSLDRLVKSLGRFSQQLRVLELARQPEVARCQARLWGPVLVFRRLWEEQGLPEILGKLAGKRRLRFDVERVCFALALQRLVAPGSDLSGSRWLSEVVGLEGIALAQLYRTCRFLAEHKERIEQELFRRTRTLFDTTVDLVFFDTTSTYFEGEGSRLRRYGWSKDHRSDRVQIVIGVVMSREGWPLAGEVYPGNTVDLTTVESLIGLVKGRLALGRVILVLDRGFVSRENLAALAASGLDYIVGARLRQVKEVREQVLGRPGRYQVVRDNLRVKEVRVGERRYVVCLNPEEAIRDAAERAALVRGLSERLAEHGPKSLLRNRGYGRYLRMESSGAKIDARAVASDARFDGKYVLETNTTLGAAEAAEAYRSLWQVEHAFRDLKSTLAVRPIFHRSDANVVGHVFGAFLALRLEIALQKKLAGLGVRVPWSRLLADLSALKAVEITLDGKEYVVRTDLAGDCYRAFQAVGLRPPPRIQSAGSGQLLCH
jgi:hypothetical protein